jgi:hypothetical protein
VEANLTEQKPVRKRRSKKRRPSSKRKPVTKAKPLPSPVEPVAAELQESAQKESGGLFGLFGSKSQANPENRPAASAESWRVSSGGSGSNEPLSAEAERLLSAIPDVIGGNEGGVALPGGETLGEVPAGAIGASLHGPEIISADDLAAMLKGAFSWVADWRKRDVYRLDDERAAALAKPWHPIVNNAWERLAPAFLARFSESNPGLIAAMFTTAVVVGPMVGADLKATAEEKALRRRSMMRESAAHVDRSSYENARAPRTASPGGGMFHDLGEAA